MTSIHNRAGEARERLGLCNEEKTTSSLLSFIQKTVLSASAYIPETWTLGAQDDCAVIFNESFIKRVLRATRLMQDSKSGRYYFDSARFHCLHKSSKIGCPSTDAFLAETVEEEPLMTRFHGTPRAQ